MCRFITADVLQAFIKAESRPATQAALLQLLWQKLLWTFVHLAKAVTLWWCIIVHICCWSRCPLWESQTHWSRPARIQTNVKTVCFFCPEGTFFPHQQVSVIYTKIFDSIPVLVTFRWTPWYKAEAHLYDCLDVNSWIIHYTDTLLSPGPSTPH